MRIITMNTVLQINTSMHSGAGQSTRLADEFEVTGGAIVNVLRYASLMALRRRVDTIRLHDITHGIRREFRKDGKVM